MAPESNTTDALLTAIDSLIRKRIRRRLRGWPEDRLEDVEQDARLNLLTALRNTKVDIQRPEAFAQKIINRCIIRAIRKQKYNRGLILLDSEVEKTINDDPADTAEFNELVAGLTLSSSQHNLIRHLQSPKSTKEIAAELGISRQTLYDQISYLRHRIKGQMMKEAA